MSNSPVFTLSAPAVLSRCPGFPLSRANIGSPAAGHKPATPAPMAIGQYTVRAGNVGIYYLVHYTDAASVM